MFNEENIFLLTYDIISLYYLLISRLLFNTCMSELHIIAITPFNLINTVIYFISSNKIVTIHKPNPFSLCCIKSCIPRRRNSSILFVNYMNTIIYLCIFIADRRAFIRTSIIYEYYFYVSYLVYDAFYALSQIQCYIIDWDDNGNNRFVHIIKYSIVV